MVAAIAQGAAGLSIGAPSDLHRAIQDLYDEKERIDQLIASLEAYLRTNAERRQALRRRGRKSMGLEERQVVSERMRTYWASRREVRGQGQKSV